MDIGITCFGDPDALYGLDRAAQIRLLGWHRATRTLSRRGPAASRELGPQVRAESPASSAFWFGQGGGGIE